MLNFVTVHNYNKQFAIIGFGHHPNNFSNGNNAHSSNQS